MLVDYNLYEHSLGGGRFTVSITGVAVRKTLTQTVCVCVCVNIKLWTHKLLVKKLYEVARCPLSL